MELIGSIVRNIVVIAILTLFLEILLPSSSLKKYAKFVMGLFILIVVIQPVFQRFQTGMPEIHSLFAWESDAEDTEEIIAAGKELGEALEAESNTVYQSDLEQQIKLVLESLTDVQNAEVEVILGDEHNVSDVIIVLTMVAPTATAGEESALAEIKADEIREEVKQVVQEFYDVPSQKIQVSISFYQEKP